MVNLETGAKLLKQVNLWYFFHRIATEKKMVQLVSLYDLPHIQSINCINIHVSFASKLFKTLSSNHYTFKLIEHEDFYKKINKISKED